MLLNFFATWCGPCKQEPRLSTDIWERFRSRGLVLLAVSRDPEDSAEKVRECTKDYTFSVATDPKGLYRQFTAEGVPRCYLITPEGRIRFMTLGSSKALEPELQRLVNVIDLELQRACAATQPAERPTSVAR